MRRTIYRYHGLEAYCIVCRRMVPARKGLSGRIFLLATHYRVNMYSGDDWIPCKGKVTASSLTHGMEDPRAAYRYARRAWGFIVPIKKGGPFDDLTFD